MAAIDPNKSLQPKRPSLYRKDGTANIFLDIQYNPLILGERAEEIVEENIGLKEQFFGLFHASDNKLGMRLFGTRHLLAKEQMRQRKHWWIIHPCSNFRMFWDCVMLIILITNLVVLPVSISYFYHHHGLDYLVFNIVCDIIFFVDIFITFRTGFIQSTSKRLVILDGKKIAMNYVKSWFALDLVSGLPLDYAFLTWTETFDSGEALRLLRMIKLFQLLRFLRVSRLVKYIKLRLEYHNTANTAVSIIRVFVVLIFVAHNTNCMMYLVSVIEYYPDDSWIMLDKIKDLHWFDQYARGLFKAFTLMLSCGYGQFPPMNLGDNWSVLWAMIIGVVSYALFISYTASVLQAIDASGKEFTDHLQHINHYMKYRKLPANLQKRVVNYFQHRYNGKLFEESAILSELSASRRRDILRLNCQELIENVPFFINADSSFVDYVLSKLEFEMFQPMDIIINFNSCGEKMYFIQEGVVEITAEDGALVTKLSNGSFFGEIALLTGGKRSATVQAGSTYCNLFSLHKTELLTMLERYPDMKSTLETIAAQRLEGMGQDSSMLRRSSSIANGIPNLVMERLKLSPTSDIDRRKSSFIETSKESSLQRITTAVKDFFIEDIDRYKPEELNSVSNDHRSIFPRSRSSGDLILGRGEKDEGKKNIFYL